MGRTVKSQEILRGLAIIDESFVDDQAGLGLGYDVEAALMEINDLT